MGEDLRYDLQKTVSLGIIDGKSAASISRDIRGYLIQPETLRGAARDALTPGRGVYRSAYKNAMRVTRTETNRAYILAQQDIATKLGYMLQFNLSQAHDVDDICDEYDGKIFTAEEYPGSLHPHCMCYPTYVLPEAA
jgi:hypothetical protein